VRTIVVLALLTTAAPAVAKEKKPKTPPPACGIKSIPLVVGNVWTYKSGALNVLIRVAEITDGKDADGDSASVIKMEEKFQERTVPTTWTCTEKKGLVIPPDSFFFAGEPGGGVGATVTITKRDSVSLMPDKELKAGAAWIEKVHGETARADVGGQGATHKPAKFEVERHVSIGEAEQIEIGMGKAKAQRVSFELRGRGIVDNEKYEIPIKRPGALFVMKGLGVMKIEDAFDRDWELVSTTVPFGKK
jgi:hypothetical protein